jgi:hypothetical protein
MESYGLKVQPGNHIHIHILGSVGECEGMSPHTPNWVPTLGIRVLRTFEFSKNDLKGQNSLD